MDDSGPTAVARQFLELLFPDLGEGLIAVFTLPNRACRFFDDAEAAAIYGVAAAATQDVYVGVGLYRPGITSGRGKREDVVAITSVWADIDFGPVHRKPGIAPDEATALKILDHIGAAPSIVVNSGHGLHCYWLLKEPLAVADGAERLARRWADYVSLVAREKVGVTVDSVPDVTRVLRLPGTVNHKIPDDLRPVTIQTIRETRVEPSDLEDWCPPEPDVLGVAVQVGPLDMGDDRTVDALMIERLCEADPRFRRTWERKRRDLKDQSASAYDLAVAHVAVVAGLTDQQTANLMLAWRRKHQEDTQKARRLGYVQRTISAARTVQKAAVAVNSLSEMPATQTIPTDERSDILRKISEALGIAVANVIQHGRENATYAFVLLDGTNVHIGGIEALLRSTVVRARIAELTRFIISGFKPATWYKLVSAILKIAELIENPEVQRTEQLREWIDSYVSHRAPIDCDREPSARFTAMFHGQSFCTDGRLYIHTGDLSRHIRYALDERASRRELTVVLRLAGWCYRAESARDGKRVICRGLWSREHLAASEAEQSIEEPTKCLSPE